MNIPKEFKAIDPETGVECSFNNEWRGGYYTCEMPVENGSYFINARAVRAIADYARADLLKEINQLKAELGNARHDVSACKEFLEREGFDYFVRDLGI